MNNTPICQQCGKQFDATDYLDESSLPVSLAAWEDCGNCDCGGQILAEPI